MEALSVKLFIFVISILLTIIGTLATLILKGVKEELKGIKDDLKILLTEVGVNSRDIAIIKVELKTKCDINNCPALKKPINETKPCWRTYN